MFKKRAELKELYAKEVEQLEKVFRVRQKDLSEAKSRGNIREALFAEAKHSFDSMDRFTGLSVLQLRTLSEWEGFKKDLELRQNRRISTHSSSNTIRKFLKPVEIEKDYSQNLELLNTEMSSAFEISSFVEKLI